MASITLKGNPVSTIGDLPKVGSAAPDFTLVGTDLGEVSKSDFEGQRVILSISPSIDTGICAATTRWFNEAAAALENTVVLQVTMDLPFAMKRFCGAEGIENVHTVSAFRSSFGGDYGVTVMDGPMKALLSRAIVVLDADHRVVYTEQVPEIAQDPDHAAALAALG